jgi:UDP-N-acetylglucosamine transferase subunit ALG13
MIFATVGSQLPFDRLIRALDEIAQDTEEEFFAQIGHTDEIPRHMKWARTMRASEFDLRAKAASAIVSHAGIGTILWAGRHGKPIAVMPRRAALDEHRNDHQVATVQHLRGRRGIAVVEDSGDLRRFLADPAASTVAGDDGDHTSLDRLRGCLSSFLRDLHVRA